MLRACRMPPRALWTRDLCVNLTPSDSLARDFPQLEQPRFSQGNFALWSARSHHIPVASSFHAAISRPVSQLSNAIFTGFSAGERIHRPREGLENAENHVRRGQVQGDSWDAFGASTFSLISRLSDRWESRRNEETVFFISKSVGRPAQIRRGCLRGLTVQISKRVSDSNLR